MIFFDFFLIMKYICKMSKNKKNYYSYKTKHYFVKSVEVLDSTDILFTSTWNIYLRDKNETEQEKDIIGTFSFQGKQKFGCIKLNFDFNRMTELGELKLAFSQRNVYSIETTFPATKDYQEIFDFLAYKKENNEGVVTLHASKPMNTLLYLFLGMITGIILGIITANIKTGIIFGFVVCGGIGIVMDSNYSRHRNFIENRD